MSEFYHIIWKKRKKEQERRPYAQIPLPLAPPEEERPLKIEKDKEKRGVYIFQM